MMTPQQLREALDRHGGNLASWPPELRDAAGRLIAADGDCARLVGIAARLERSLDALVEPIALTSAEIGRVLAGGETGGRPGEAAFRPGRRLAALAAAGLVVCLAAGFTLGLVLPSDSDDAALAGLVFGGAQSENGAGLL